MKVTIKNNEEAIWTYENIKRATIYNQQDDSENKMLVIDGFVENVPNGYFVQSFPIGDFDRICLEER